MNALVPSQEAAEALHVGELVGVPRETRRPASALLRATEMALSQRAVVANNDGNRPAAKVLGRRARQLRLLVLQQAIVEALTPGLGELWGDDVGARFVAGLSVGMPRYSVVELARGCVANTPQPAGGVPMPLTEDEAEMAARAVVRCWEQWP